MKKLVAPSILSADFVNLASEVDAVTKAGADWLHVDVMDGHFVNNITIGPPVVKSLKRVAKIPLDVHLMIEKPERYIKEFINAGADYLTIHVEATENPEQVLKDIRALGAKPGITLRPRTSLDAIKKFLPLVDLVLVMTVEPGFGGQSFMADQVPKITELKKLKQENNYRYLIEVDGGVNSESLPMLEDAEVLVAGNFIFSQDYKTAIKLLKKGN